MEDTYICVKGERFKLNFLPEENVTITETRLDKFDGILFEARLANRVVCNIPVYDVKHIDRVYMKQTLHKELNSIILNLLLGEPILEEKPLWRIVYERASKLFRKQV